MSEVLILFIVVVVSSYQYTHMILVKGKRKIKDNKQID